MRYLCLFFFFVLAIRISQAQTVNIPDANFKAKLLNHTSVIDSNGDDEIQISEAENFTGVLNLDNDFYTLDEMKIIDMTGIEAFINASGLSFDYNLVTEIDISNNTLLSSLDCYNNQLVALDISNNLLLTFLNCQDNKLSDLDVTKNNLLNNMSCGENKLISIDVSQNPLLEIFYCSRNEITDLDVSMLEFLEVLVCETNELTTLDVSNNLALRVLSCGRNLLETIDISNNILLTSLSCDGNQLKYLNLDRNTQLVRLNCGQNQLSNLDLSKQLLLENLTCDRNPLLTSLDVTHNSLLSVLWIYDLPLIDLDLSQNLLLERLTCGKHQIASIDLSMNTKLDRFSTSNSYFLKNINLKNTNPTSVIAGGCPNLETICVDDVDYAIANSRVDPHAVFVEDCSVTNVDYNIIEGVLTFDENNNSCDISDPIIPNILIKATDGINEFATFTNVNGVYSIPVVENTYETSPSGLISNSITPSLSTNTFSGFNNSETIDFCVAFNQNQYDVNIKLIPVTQARPGFDSRYQLVYENLGLTIDTGSITLVFDNAMQSFIKAIPSESASTSKTVTFNYSNLKPFEKRVINVTMNTFTPPTVNGDDVLNFEASILPSVSDVSPKDNKYSLAQVVVNSFDPNDKAVLQGVEISPDEIDMYLDYIIRFQNTGTASAINVVVTDVLSSKLDWNSIKLVSSCHTYTTRITDGNFIEFIFENINLPAEQDNEIDSNGFIVFKVKPKSDVIIGDIITGTANIYFDFNAPIETNTVSTEIVDEALSVTKNELSSSILIYPNPVTTEFYIEASNDFIINRIAVYSVAGKKLFQTTKNLERYDLSNFTSGIYFVKVETNKGFINKRLIKK